MAGHGTVQDQLQSGVDVAVVGPMRVVAHWAYSASSEADLSLRHAANLYHRVR